MVGGKTGRRPHQRGADQGAMRAEPCSMGEALPRRRVVGDEVAYAPRGGAVGMPQAAADEAVARRDVDVKARCVHFAMARSEEHTSELQSLMRISYAVFCLKK